MIKNKTYAKLDKQEEAIEDKKKKIKDQKFRMPHETTPKKSKCC